MVFLPAETAAASAAVRDLEQAITARGFSIPGLARSADAAGDFGRNRASTLPVIRQILAVDRTLGAVSFQDRDRRLYLARKQFERGGSPGLCLLSLVFFHHL